MRTSAPHRLLRAALALGLVLAPAAPAPAQPTEEAIKAAFLPKFARYVTWPGSARPGPRAAFNLCLVGRDPFGQMLDQSAAGELIDGHGVGVQRHASAETASRCHIAFVQGRTQRETAELLRALANRPVLTVTDSRAGPQRGMIHFTVAGGRVRFYIDEAAAASRGLSISSRLLALALSVRQRRS